MGLSDFQEEALAFLWVFYGVSIGFLWVFHDISLGFPWDTPADFHWISVSALWDFFDNCWISASFLWGFHGIHMGLPLYSFFLGDSYGMPLGLP